MQVILLLYTFIHRLRKRLRNSFVEITSLNVSRLELSVGRHSRTIAA